MWPGRGEECASASRKRVKPFPLAQQPYCHKGIEKNDKGPEITVELPCQLPGCEGSIGQWIKQVEIGSGGEDRRRLIASTQGQ